VAPAWFPVRAWRPVEAELGIAEVRLPGRRWLREPPGRSSPVVSVLTPGLDPGCPGTGPLAALLAVR